MNYILDTHVFIWFINGDEHLPASMVNIIKNTDNNCFLSVASLWEITIKHSLKRLELSGGFENIQSFINENDIQLLHLSFKHFQILKSLEFHHKDPFDRLIIAQGIAEDIAIITKDDFFSDYQAKIIW